MRVSYAIVFVSDMKRGIAFYRDVVGLPLKFESPGWAEFATEGATLALHPTDAKAAKDEPGAKPPGRCRPGFAVPDINAFHAKMTERKVTCVQPPKDIFGNKVAQYLDPDGLEFSVSEERKGR